MHDTYVFLIVAGSIALAVGLLAAPSAFIYYLGIPAEKRAKFDKWWDEWVGNGIIAYASAGLWAAALNIVARISDDYLLKMLTRPIPLVVIIYCMRRFGSKAGPNAWYRYIITIGMTIGCVADVLVTIVFPTDEGLATLTVGIFMLFFMLVVYAIAFTFFLPDHKYNAVVAPFCLRRGIVAALFSTPVIVRAAQNLSPVPYVNAAVIIYTVLAGVAAWRALARVGVRGADYAARIAGAVGAIGLAVAGSMRARGVLYVNGMGGSVVNVAYAGVFWLAHALIAYSTVDPSMSNVGALADVAARPTNAMRERRERREGKARIAL